MNDNMIQQNGIIVNQVNPVLEKPITFGINRKILICPYCNKKITTEVEKKFNYSTLCCFLLILILIPLIIFLAPASCNGNCCNCKKEQKYKSEEPTEIPDKDCCNCCDDAAHYCPECKKILGSYSSSPCAKNQQ